jgi:hypothetical protein
MRNPNFAMVVTSVTSLPVKSIEESPRRGTGSSVTNVTNGHGRHLPGLRPLVALTLNEAADLLELARAGAADDYAAVALLCQLSALVDRARLHTNRKEADL